MAKPIAEEVPTKQISSVPTQTFFPLDLDAYEFLRSLREFSEVPPEQLKALAAISRFTSLDSGDYIVNEGEHEGHTGYIVVSGSLALLKTSSSGRQLIVELLQAGDVFGMLLRLAAERRSVQLSARALKKTMLLLIPVDQFHHFLAKNVVLFEEFAAHLLLCLQSSYNLSRGLAHDRVEVRIAAVLTSLTLKILQPSSTKFPYTIYFTRQQIADLTGTTPETAIRVTRAMQRDGLIDISRPGIIHILNVSALQEMAEGC